MFGGSRESLPLSVLSGTIIHPSGDSGSLRGESSGHYARSTLNAERASLISASGVTAPALASERNSYIGSKYGGDAASVRSGLLGAGGHGRNDSLSGSITGAYREKEAQKEKDRAVKEDLEKENDAANTPGMVTAPTSPLVDGHAFAGAGTLYSSTSALGDVSEALEIHKEKK